MSETKKVSYSFLDYTKEFECPKCGSRCTRECPPLAPTLIWDFYCIVCLEKFLDENIGKMKEVNK